MSENIDVKTIAEDTAAANTGTQQKDGWENVFHEYKSKKSVAEKILEQLNERFITVTDDKGHTRQGFRLDDSSDQIGLLSQCHSLQALVSLAQDYGLSFKDELLTINGKKHTIRQIMDIVIEDVLETVCVIPEEDKNKGDLRFDNATGYIFDASPYNHSCFSEEYSNVDAITWVITSFLLILKHHAEVLHEVCKWEKALVDVIRYGLQYLNDAFIDGSAKEGAETKDENEDKSKGEDEDKDEEGKKPLQIGWNFTKACEEPSLYFSYTVCECYLDIFETFKCFLEHLHAVRNKTDYFVEINSEKEKTYNDKKKEYEENRNRQVDESTRQARYDGYNELARIYRLINNIDDHAELTIDPDQTLYGKLEANCKKVASRVWALTQNRLADHFFYNDLLDTVSEDDIRKSTTSDVLFNTAYIVNILLCAGMDEVLDLKRQKHEYLGEEWKAREKQQEYDNLLESCLLAVQKAFRTYEKLKNAGKDYIVDQFLIGFNEKFNNHQVNISELRKLRMRTFSLLPVLIHTNNKMNEYLVKYPHYSMSKYYQNILDNRLVKDGEPLWIWERDGFFSGSNYYYVLALKGFYDYYETYEEKYIPIGNENNDRVKEIQENYLKTLQQDSGPIGQARAEIRDKDRIISTNEKSLEAKDAEINRLKEEIENVRKQYSVENAVENVAKSVLEKELAKTFTQMLTRTAAVLTPNVINNTQDDDDGTYNTLGTAMSDMMITAMLNHFCHNTQGAISTSQQYADLKKRLSTDFAAVILEYVTSIKDAGGTEEAKSSLRNMLERY